MLLSTERKFLEEIKQAWKFKTEIHEFALFTRMYVTTVTGLLVNYKENVDECFKELKMQDSDRKYGVVGNYYCLK